MFKPIRGMSKKRVGILGVLMFAFIAASSASLYAIARGYTSDDTGLQIGMVASLSKEGESKVERTTYDNQKLIVGVVADPDEASVSLGSAESVVFVESEGEVLAYVADTNGEVSNGDALSLSVLKGVLQKATGGAGELPVIATATENSSASQASSDFEMSDGTQTKVHKIKVNLIRQGAGLEGQQDIPDSALAKLGRALTGRDVGDSRVILALILFVIVLIAEGSIIYGAVSSAITSLGRNPMAKSAIARELLQVSAVAVLVLAVGLGAVYGVLRI